MHYDEWLDLQRCIYDGLSRLRETLFGCEEDALDFGLALMRPRLRLGV